jgi:hypothetical protein
LSEAEPQNLNNRIKATERNGKKQTSLSGSNRKKPTLDFLDEGSDVHFAFAEDFFRRFLESKNIP